MDLSIFNKNDTSGKLYKEDYLIKFYPEEYDYIINYCIVNSLDNLPFKEKVYNTIHNIKEITKCKNPNCNNPTKYKNSNLGYKKYCSIKCINSDPEIIKQKEERSLKKFGTKIPSQSSEIKNKIIKTNQKKYGSNSPMCLINIQEKSKKTLLENHGVDNPSKSLIITKKRIESFKKSSYKKTYKKTSIEKYGVDHPWMNKEIHDKTIEFFYKDYKNRIISRIENKNYSFIDFKFNPTSIILNCGQCGDNFNILPYQFYYRSNIGNSICTNCYPISDNSSLMQVELADFIRNNYDGEIIINEKKIISPYEIGIFLPKLNIGFEFNGLWWHSEAFKENTYHKSKFNKSVENNIKLYTIWEDDWVMTSEICKSFILNKLNKSKKIWARKCTICEIDYKISRKFLIDNHLQGDCKSSIRIGLLYENELITLMTFSKLRLPLSQKNKDTNTYELTRFCNKLNTSVVGGASKLFKYFIENYKPKEVQTYSDNLISTGELYKNLKFEYNHTSEPGYWYVINEKREHRFNWRKSKLIKMGYDKNKTEHEIMSDLGYYRVYNAGNKKWIYKTILI